MNTCRLPAASVTSRTLAPDGALPGAGWLTCSSGLSANAIMDSSSDSTAVVAGSAGVAGPPAGPALPPAAVGATPRRTCTDANPRSSVACSGSLAISQLSIVCLSRLETSLTWTAG